MKRSRARSKAAGPVEQAGAFAAAHGATLTPLPRLTLPFPFFRLQRVNLANQLTLLRIALLPLFVSLFLADSPWAQWASLLVFAFCALTDWLDGKIARERDMVTNFGKIMDPLADKLLMLTAMISLVQVGVVPGWMIVVIWWRELGVTGLRTLAATRAKILAADRWGKAKTGLQIAAVVAGMLVYAVQNTLNPYSEDWRVRLDNQGWWGELLARVLDTNALAFWLMFVAAIASLISGIRYFRKNWEAVCEELEGAERL